MLTDAGATVQNKRVCLPPELVDACIAKCPPQVHVRGRGGNPQTLGDGSLHFHNLGGARDIHNPTTDEHRFAILQDVRDATRLLDALPSCNTITPFFTPSDVPGKLMTLAMYRHAMPFTTKPLQGPGVQTAPEVRYAVQMAGVIGPPSEVLTLSVSPVSPLSFPDHEVEAMLEVARQGIAFAPLPCPTAGTTAPFSIAGGIAQQAAEVLACLVWRSCPAGLPIIFCGRLAMMERARDFGLGGSKWGSLPPGPSSLVTVMDYRSTSRHRPTPHARYGTVRARSGYSSAGHADEALGDRQMAGVLSTYAQMVADNEFAGSIQRARRGFSTDVDAVAVDVIATVMNGPRNFLGQKHTTRYLKGGEVLLTKLAERSSWETWEQGNRWGLAEQAQAESERILREHQVEPLSDAQEKALDEIMSAAENELVKV
jgi:trimethylamine--corrinoid protein Co-methyltransferase